jgi:aryl sulfotransferase
MLPSVRYRSPDEDSGRWDDFAFRDGDIVISTRSKTGSTWVQMICALLVFRTPDLPAPLSEISPWLDWLIFPRDEIYARLEAQEHRRFIKTHTPLDGVPIDPKANYIVTGRHPLDMAVSLYHQSLNIDRARLRALTGAAEPDAPQKQLPPVRDWLVKWIGSTSDPKDALDSLPGIMWHMTDAWSRRAEPNVVLVHYDDLSRDLDAEMRRLAGLLDFGIDEAVWPRLVRGATFSEMQAGHAKTAPDPQGIFLDKAAFFRGGRSGDGASLLEPDDLARYQARVANLAPADLLDWLHHGSTGAAMSGR